ncbi:hypothetical protein [Roseovarius nubinhibens]|uniref:hypothetical protein n=1 Tax=Roseovarius nubinhibens TaxID=314263 RepID=UPI001C2F7E63|nr:hypothetical protein [Roseovarius nubinhibens]
MLSECSPNQLVRILRTGFDAKFALVCDVPIQNKRGLVSFGEDDAVFEMFEDADTISVLAYGGELVWELDQEGPFEPPIREIFSKTGCFFVTNGGAYLSLQRAHAQRKNPALLNIEKGCVEPYRELTQGVAIFGSWKLFLEEPERPIESRTKITEFCVKAGG